MSPRLSPAKALICGFGALFALALSCRGNPVTVYSLTAPVDGYSGIDLSFGPGSSGGCGTVFGTLNEMLYYDSVANTLRQSGYVTISPTSGTFDISPWVGTATGHADLTIGDENGRVFFDTGVCSLLDRSTWTLSIPVRGLCTIYDNGQVTTGPVSYTVDLHLLTDILSVDPTSLTVREYNFLGSEPGKWVGSVAGIGLIDGTSDGTYFYRWDLGRATAIAVPEDGNSLVLLILSVCALWILWVRERPFRMGAARAIGCHHRPRR